MEEHYTLLMIDDDELLTEAVTESLETEGYCVNSALTGKEGLAQLEAAGPDLLLLDLKLPDTHGRVLCKTIHEKYPELPIIVLTGEDDDIDRVLLLELGADNYLQKPVAPRVLLAYIEATLRRSKAKPIAQEDEEESSNPTKLASHYDLLLFADFELNIDQHTLEHKERGSIDLTPGEYQLLYIFVTHPERILSRDQIISYKETGDDIFDRSIDIIISRLRKKLEKNPKQPMLIKTNRGSGYSLQSPVYKKRIKK